MATPKCVVTPEQEPVLRQQLVETVRLFDGMREQAFAAWLDSRAMAVAGKGAAAAEGKVVPGNLQFLRLALTCLERRCQLLDVKTLAHSNPAVALQALEAAPLDRSQVAELVACAEAVSLPVGRLDALQDPGGSPRIEAQPAPQHDEGSDPVRGEADVARQESEREDLLREAAALVERAEWQVPGQAEPVTVGFKRTGDLAIYFGGDPVFQFDPQGRLRRAFREGDLYRTQGTTLAKLVRTRTADQTVLERTDLDPQTLREFKTFVATRLRELVAALADSQVVVRGQVPPESDHRERVQAILTRLLDRGLPLAPPIPTKRQ